MCLRKLDCQLPARLSSSLLAALEVNRIRVKPTEAAAVFHTRSQLDAGSIVARNSAPRRSSRRLYQLLHQTGRPPSIISIFQFRRKRENSRDNGHILFGGVGFGGASHITTRMIIITRISCEIIGRQFSFFC